MNGQFVIKKKDIEKTCETLSSLIGTFCFYDMKERLLFKPIGDGLFRESERMEVSVNGLPVGYITGSPENLSIIAPIIGMYIEKIQEKRSLTLHTLHKYTELNFLNSMSEFMSSSIDLDEILCAVTEKIQEMIGVENCSVMVVNKKGDRFYLKTVSGRKISEDMWIPIGKGIAGRVKETGKAILVEEAHKHPDFLSGGTLDIKNLLCIPLKVKDKTIGVLNLSNKKTGIFTSEDEALLASVSAMITGAIENARLVEEKIMDEKFAAIGQMAAGIIHDIKNPMTTIKGFAGLLGDMDFSKNERKEYAGLIVGEINRLVGMVEDLLAFTRGFKTKLSVEKISVEKFFGEVIPFIEKDFSSRNIEVIKSLDYNGDFSADLERLKRVVFNIAGNAKEEMHAGGKFCILTRAVDERFIEIVFADTGKGIPDDIIDAVFEPFVTKGKRSGTGLGLAITKKIIEEHGGTITAVNGNYTQIEGFEGANFVIKLPV
jgi:signal transduction histidine kinase